MSQTSVFKPNFSDTIVASLMSFWLYVSCSGSISPSTRSPPIDMLESAAIVLLSTPPDKPMTIPVAPEFSTYSLMKRAILLSTSPRSNSRTDGFNLKLGSLFPLLYGCRQLFKDKHE